MINQKKLKTKDLLRKLVPTRLKRVVIRLICNEKIGWIVAKIYRDRIPFRGLMLDTTSPRIRGSTKAELFFEIYERSEIDQTLAFLSKEFEVIECGASIGANTTQILKLTDKNVYAIEADPEIIEVLKANIELNFAQKSNVTIINAAIDYSGKDSVVFSRGHDNLRGNIATNNTSDLVADTVAVSVTTLSEVLSRYNIEKYTLVIDIEGAEAALFVKDTNALTNCFMIIAEIDGGTVDGDFYTIQDLVDYLKLKNFNLIYSHANRMVFENHAFDSA